MQPTTHMDPHLPQKGWPLWLLAAVAPVVLALGIVGGMAIATYAPHTRSPVAATEAAPNTTTPAPSQATAQTPPQSAASTPDDRDLSRFGGPQEGTLPMPGPHANSLPDATPSGTPPKDIREARQELARVFGRLQIGGRTVSTIDYQQMRNAGTSVSLVGIIRVSDYTIWAAIQRENPDLLRTWLENAAKRVQSAAEHDRFWLSWAVVEVRTNPPDGFASFEVTPLANDSYLVVRPLAATIDPANTTISLRDPISDTPEGDRKLIGSSPWATYGPAIRFDSTDLYRPGGLAGTTPEH